MFRIINVLLRHTSRMVDLIPILLQYVKSRQKPGGQVLWVAHNARCFDVPFLIKEFNRCSKDIPSDWIFLDTLAMARELTKSGGRFVVSVCIVYCFDPPGCGG